MNRVFNRIVPTAQFHGITQSMAAESARRCACGMAAAACTDDARGGRSLRACFLLPRKASEPEY